MAIVSRWDAAAVHWRAISWWALLHLHVSRDIHGQGWQTGCVKQGALSTRLSSCPWVGTWKGSSDALTLVCSMHHARVVRKAS